jgi:hypothetical protein
MDTESLLKEMEELFRGKIFITIEDITVLLSCDEKTVINWTKRSDVNRRPPRIYVGNEVRFHKRSFIEWLLIDQGIIKS